MNYNIIQARFKPKDLVPIPWMLALALQADGWYLRSDIIWHKPNPMPESVTDRPTKSHEYLFLMSKAERYFYDAEAIKETAQAENPKPRPFSSIEGARARAMGKDSSGNEGNGTLWTDTGFRNKRTVWTVPTSPFSDWTKTVRWQRVSGGDFACGNLHIASLDCPVYGGLFDLVATALCDGRADGDWSRIAGICDRLSLAPKAGFAPIETLCAWGLMGRSVDSVVRQCCETASARNTGSRKTDLFVSTSLSCKPSAQRSNRILSILAECGLSEQHRDMLASNTWVDGFDDNQKPQTICRIVGKDNLQDVCLALGPTYAKTTIESSHFATFPPDLIKPCILAGTSAKGCCPKCGAPWERLIEKEYKGSAGVDYKDNGASRGKRSHTGGGAWAAWKAEHPDKDLGWQPSCDCGEEQTAPCTVLDPFGGSGTTGQVALELGRRAILIELNPKYVTLIENRTHVTPGLPLA